MARLTKRMSVLSNTAVFLPAADGRPTLESIKPLIRPNPSRSHPYALGAENELSTCLTLESKRMFGSPGSALIPVGG